MGPRSRERGAGLVEVLMAVAILGIATTALLGGLTTLIVASDSKAEHARAATVLTSAADRLRDSSVTHVRCALPSEASYLAAVRSAGLPPGWTSSAITITAVQYWDGEGFGTTCHDTDALGRLLRLQLVTIAVQSPDGRGAESVSVVKAP